MKIVVTVPFRRDFKKLPKEVKQRAEKSLKILISNPRHPSLNIKKVKGRIIKDYFNIFEARITKNYRFLFLVEEDTYVLLRCGEHDEFFK